jgi:flagellar export protein FliJ
MKQTKYKLNTVMDVRQQDKSASAKNLAACQDELDKQRIELSNRVGLLKDEKRKLSASNSDLDDHIRAGAKIGDIVSHKRYLESLKDSVAVLEDSVHHQHQVVKISESKVKEALDELKQASKALSIVEKHKENWTNRQQERVKKDEQNKIDEISAILHRRNKNI